MTLRKLHSVLETNPELFPRFVLPDGDYIPAHAHVTEVGHVVRNFIDCGGLTGKEERAVLQTHVGNDTDHRLRSDRFAKILELASRVIPNADLDVDVEYDCCVVAQYPIAEARPDGDAPEPDLASRPDAMPGAGSVATAKRQRAVAQHPRLVVSRHGPHRDLSVLLRSHAIAHSQSSHKISALRLSFSGHPW